MIRELFTYIALSLIEVLSPDLCLFCGLNTDQTLTLGRCSSGLRPWDRPGLCRSCERELADGVSPTRLSGQSTDSILLVGGTASHGKLVAVVGDFKYHRIRGLAEPLGRIAAQGLTMAERYAGPVDLLLPIPLHRQRLKTRGFNQAHLLADVMGDLHGLPVRADILSRKRKTSQQAKINASDHASRSANVAASFAAVPAPEKCVRVGLVDDLITSGATIIAAAEALSNAGWDVIWAVAVGLSTTKRGDLDRITSGSYATRNGT